MKSYFNIVFPSFFLCTVLFGCAKKCPDFDNSVLNWMPFVKSDSVHLLRDSISYDLNVYYSEIRHTKKVSPNAKCECENVFSVGLSSDSLDIQVFFNSASVSDSYVNINSEILAYKEQLSSYLFNGKTYSDVVIYENQTDAVVKRFSKVVVSKGIGIVGIIGFGEEWIPENDAPHSIDQSKVDLNQSSC